MGGTIALLGIVTAAATGWIAYHASLSVTNLLLALVLGAVATLVIGSVAALKIGRDALRRGSSRPGMVVTAIATFALAWAGIALATFMLTLLETSITVFDGLN